MISLYSALWVMPVSADPIEDGAIAVEGTKILDVGPRSTLEEKFPTATIREFGPAAILPGLINSHSHLELTAMRGFLENEVGDFAGWLRKLTVARLEKMTADDRYVSAAWGACEAVRAGVTAVADASDEARETMKALRVVGLRGTVFQESFGPDPRLAIENFEKLKSRLANHRNMETALVKVGVSPHAVYTVCAQQLELISDYAMEQNLPLMMHAAESAAEETFVRDGQGVFAEILSARGIEWIAPGISPVQYLKRHGILQTEPLLAHCIRVDEKDLDALLESSSRVAHCPKSNAKLGHGFAPFRMFLKRRLRVGIGSDSVASNNTCDLFEEARFAILAARANAGATELKEPDANDGLRAATLGGAQALKLEGQVGELKKGSEADFAVVRLCGTHQLPSYDPASTLIFSSTGRDVVLTVVAGREVYREDRVLTVDEDHLRARMKEITAKLSS